jgi:tetratricopeptide (TPR) repeat protein
MRCLIGRAPSLLGLLLLLALLLSAGASSAATPAPPGPPAAASPAPPPAPRGAAPTPLGVPILDEEPPPSGWQPNLPPNPRAADFAARATRLFESRQYLESAEELARAFSIDPQPLYLFNRGQALRLADKPQDALLSYQQFLVQAPTHRLAPEAKGYVADMRVLIAERQRAELARLLLEAEQVRASQEAEILRLRADRAEEDKRKLAEQLSRSRRPVYKRAWFWVLVGGVAAATATAVGVGVCYSNRPQVDGGFADIRF